MSAEIVVRDLRKVFNPGSTRELTALHDVTFTVARGELVCVVGPSGCGKSTILNVLAGLETAFEGEVLVDGSPLHDVTFTVARGELVCVVGPSGCGKSTILNVLAGLETAFEGEVLVDGSPLRARGTRHRPIAYVFQEPRLLPWLTLERNVHFALDCQGVPRGEWRSRTDQVLSLVGLTEFVHLYAHQLSGGMQQRASIARALAIDPQILLMDEPFSSLDEFTARDLRQQLLAIWAATGKTILFVTHNSFEATYLADRIILMTRRPGRIFDEITVDLPRPRQYDDADVFEANRAVVTKFFKGIAQDQGR